MPYRSRRRSRRSLLPLVLMLLATTALIAPSAFASPGTVVGTIAPSPVGAGTTQATTFTISTTSGQVSSFNLTAPTGWNLTSLTPQAGITLVSSTQIQGRNISASSSSSLTITFSSQAPCAASSTAWSLVAKSGGNFTGSSFDVDPSSVLSTPLSGSCTSAFVANRGPADAAFNGNVNGPSENITSQPYAPNGASLQALVSDADGSPRSGISITLQLSANPTSATLSGPVTVASDANGLATFPGTPANPIAINKIGLNYAMTPAGSGVGSGIIGTASGPFGIYQEGEVCVSGQSCVVHGKSGDNHIDTTVSAPDNGTLAVLVQEFSLECTGFTPLSSQVIIWKYTGDGTQTVAALLDKFLVKTVIDRGSAHIDVCFQTDNGKTFTDKFGNVGVTIGLLSDCGPGITINCIISENGVQGGGRLVVFTVEDGKGRI